MMTNHGRSWADEENGEGGLVPEDPDKLTIFEDQTYSVIMKGTTEKLRNTRPKIIYNLLDNKKVIQNIYDCVKLQSGDFLLNINISEKEKVFNITSIGDIPVSFQEAWDINNTKVTMRYDDLINYSKNNEQNINEELLSDLRKQNPNLSIRNAEIQTKYDRTQNTRVNTQFAVVTLVGKFSELQIQKIKLSLNFEKINLKLFVPLPKLCKNCWSFGHFSTKKHPCPKIMICGNCSDDFHLKMENGKVVGTCDRNPLCNHCKKSHPSWFKNCQVYKKEQEYMEIATKQRISYGKAKSLQENKEKSYANITRRSNDNQLPRQNHSDDIYRQILKQQNDKLVKQITNLQKEMRTLTTIIRTICLNSNIDLTTIVNESESDAMDIPSSGSGDEEVPPTQQDPRRSVVPPLSPEELSKLSNGGVKPRGNKNGPPKFRRAIDRQNKLEKTESVPPNKYLKLTKSKHI